MSLRAGEAPAQNLSWFDLLEMLGTSLSLLKRLTHHCLKTGWGEERLSRSVTLITGERIGNQ